MDEPRTLAYSPCPNDTYIFAAWTEGLLTEAPRVTTVLDDVEALNNAALSGRYALTKVSYGLIPNVLSHYRILRAGGALGRGCGPLLLTRTDGAQHVEALPPTATIAIPGEHTTAYLLLRLALGYTPRIVTMRFDRIIDAVRNGNVDAGLIIHESRFTYHQAALQSIADLGVWWESKTGLPLPLGAILARRDISPGEAAMLSQTIRESIAYARRDTAAIALYIRAHAHEMEEAVMQAHISLYVNAFSDDLGDEGESAVRTLLDHAVTAGILPTTESLEFC